MRRTNKGENARRQSNKKREASSAPATSVVESGKDIGRRSVRSQIDQWNQNPEEADDVNDENDGFDPRQHTDQVRVDKQGDDDDGVK